MIKVVEYSLINRAHFLFKEYIQSNNEFFYDVGLHQPEVEIDPIAAKNKEEKLAGLLTLLTTLEFKNQRTFSNVTDAYLTKYILVSDDEINNKESVNKYYLLNCTYKNKDSDKPYNLSIPCFFTRNHVVLCSPFGNDLAVEDPSIDKKANALTSIVDKFFTVMIDIKDIPTKEQSFESLSNGTVFYNSQVLANAKTQLNNAIEGAGMIHKLFEEKFNNDLGSNYIRQSNLSTNLKGFIEEELPMDSDANASDDIKAISASLARFMPIMLDASRVNSTNRLFDCVKDGGAIKNDTDRMLFLAADSHIRPSQTETSEIGILQKTLNTNTIKLIQMKKESEDTKVLTFEQEPEDRLLQAPNPIVVVDDKGCEDVVIIKLPSNAYLTGDNRINIEFELGSFYQYDVDFGYAIKKSYLGMETFVTEGVKETLDKTGKKVKRSAAWIESILKRSGVTLSHHVMEIFKPILSLAGIPIKNFINMAKGLWKIFAKPVEFEKDLTIEMKEKLMNDDLNAFNDLLKNSVYPISMFSGAFMITGDFVFGVISLMLSRWRVERASRKAVERIEMQLDGEREILEIKLRKAQSDGDHEKELVLTRQLRTIKYGKQKLLDYKRETTLFDGDKMKYREDEKDNE